jgi:RimJ/RimL family protein N-acetyltransferase
LALNESDRPLEMAHPIWPLFDLEVTTPRLALRYANDDIATALAMLAGKGIHNPEFMPFQVPWTDVASPLLELHTLQYYWRVRAALSPEKWDLLFGAFVDGTLVGCTAIHTEDYPASRSFTTGSWLGREFQGLGFGTEMRRATLALGFIGFDALVARTDAFDDNAASLGVTRKLGYTQDGESVKSPRGEPQRSLQFSLDRETFICSLLSDITLHGVDNARRFLLIEPR